MSGIEQSILRGDYDANLGNIIDAVKMRKDALAPKAWDFSVGDRVRYISGVRPKYLAGEEGIVSKVNRTKVVVKLDRAVGRFYGNITTPTSLIEKV